LTSDAPCQIKREEEKENAFYLELFDHSNDLNSPEIEIHLLTLTEREFQWRFCRWESSIERQM